MSPAAPLKQSKYAIFIRFFPSLAIRSPVPHPHARPSAARIARCRACCDHLHPRRLVPQQPAHRSVSSCRVRQTIICLPASNKRAGSPSRHRLRAIIAAPAAAASSATHPWPGRHCPTTATFARPAGPAAAAGRPPARPRSPWPSPPRPSRDPPPAAAGPHPGSPWPSPQDHRRGQHVPHDPQELLLHGRVRQVDAGCDCAASSQRCASCGVQLSPCRSSRSRRASHSVFCEYSAMPACSASSGGRSDSSRTPSRGPSSGASNAFGVTKAGTCTHPPARASPSPAVAPAGDPSKPPPGRRRSFWELPAVAARIDADQPADQRQRPPAPAASGSGTAPAARSAYPAACRRATPARRRGCQPRQRCHAVLAGLSGPACAVRRHALPPAGPLRQPRSARRLASAIAAAIPLVRTSHSASRLVAMVGSRSGLPRIVPPADACSSTLSAVQHLLRGPPATPAATRPIRSRYAWVSALFRQGQPSIRSGRSKPGCSRQNRSSCSSSPARSSASSRTICRSQDRRGHVPQPQGQRQVQRIGLQHDHAAVAAEPLGDQLRLQPAADARQDRVARPGLVDSPAVLSALTVGMLVRPNHSTRSPRWIRQVAARPGRSRAGRTRG